MKYCAVDVDVEYSSFYNTLPRRITIDFRGTLVFRVSGVSKVMEYFIRIDVSDCLTSGFCLSILITKTNIRFVLKEN